MRPVALRLRGQPGRLGLFCQFRQPRPRRFLLQQRRRRHHAAARVPVVGVQQVCQRRIQRPQRPQCGQRCLMVSDASHRLRLTSTFGPLA